MTKLYHLMTTRLLFEPGCDLVAKVDEYAATLGTANHAYGKLVDGELNKLKTLIKCPSLDDKALEQQDEYHMVFGGNQARDVEQFLTSGSRHQGSIYSATYYVLQFLLEMLMREPDLIDEDAASKFRTLDIQLWYEMYILDVLIRHYRTFHGYRGNFEQVFHDPQFDTLRHAINIHKDTLLQNCADCNITPVRALFLFVTDCTENDIQAVLDICGPNKYVRTSLFWVAGFKGFNVMPVTERERSAFGSGQMFIQGYKHWQRTAEGCYGQLVNHHEIFHVIDNETLEENKKWLDDVEDNLEVANCRKEHMKEKVEDISKYTRSVTYFPFYHANSECISWTVIWNLFTTLDYLGPIAREYYHHYQTHDEEPLDFEDEQFGKCDIPVVYEEGEDDIEKGFVYGTEHNTIKNALTEGNYVMLDDDCDHFSENSLEAEYAVHTLYVITGKVNRPSEVPYERNCVVIAKLKWNAGNEGGVFALLHGEFQMMFTEEKRTDQIQLDGKMIITSDLLHIFEHCMDDIDKQMLCDDYGLDVHHWDHVCATVQRVIENESMIIDNEELACHLHGLYRNNHGYSHDSDGVDMCT
jgi:hypothetical protein